MPKTNLDPRGLQSAPRPYMIRAEELLKEGRA
jgi:hypothetical protein